MTEIEPSLKTLLKYISLVQDEQLREILEIITDELNCLYLELEMHRQHTRKKMSKEKGMTWEELASWYDKNIGGRKARTLSMDTVFDACVASGKFTLTEDGGIKLKEAQ